MRIDVPLPARPEWERVPARRLFERVRREPREDDEIITAFRDGQVTLRTNRRVEGFTNAVQEYGYQGVRAGDLVIHSMDGFAGAMGVSDGDGKASPVVHCYVPESRTDPRYYAYLLRILAQREFITSLARGIRERSTAFDAETFRSLVLPHPPLDEQRAIADYLDAETARIDALIAKKQQLIHLLEERWKTWLAETLDEGVTVQVRHVTSLRTSGPRGWADRIGDTGRPFVRSANLTQNSIDLKLDELARVDPPTSPEALRSQIRTGDSLVGITGANTGWVASADSTVDGGFVSQHVAILRPSQVDGRWLTYSIASPKARDQLLGGQYGGTKTQLGLDELAELTIRVPAQTEQVRRVRLLDERYEASRRCVESIRSQIGLLAEHRRALITAAVSGDLSVAASA